MLSLNQDTSNTILFFGYGAYRSKSKLTQVLGHPIGDGVGGILEGYVLVYQTIEQLPESLRDFFRTTYGNNFKAYTIKKGHGVISGMIWEIEAQDLEILKKWEFVPEWREIVEVKVTSAGEKDVLALTEKVKANQPHHEIADGVDYEEFENPRVTHVDSKQLEQNEYKTTA